MLTSFIQQTYKTYTAIHTNNLKLSRKKQCVEYNNNGEQEKHPNKRIKKNMDGDGLMKIMESMLFSCQMVDDGSSCKTMMRMNL